MNSGYEKLKEEAPKFIRDKAYELGTQLIESKGNKKEILRNFAQDTRHQLVDIGRNELKNTLSGKEINQFADTVKKESKNQAKSTTSKISPNAASVLNSLLAGRGMRQQPQPIYGKRKKQSGKGMIPVIL